jgi:hypothetical protein
MSAAQTGARKNRSLHGYGDTGGHRPTRDPRLRMGLLAAAVAGPALLAAGCGGGGSHTAGSGAVTRQNLSAQLDAYASWVRRHGVPNFYVTRVGSTPPSPGTVSADQYAQVCPRR